MFKRSISFSDRSVTQQQNVGKKIKKQQEDRKRRSVDDPERDGERTWIVTHSVGLVLNRVYGSLLLLVLFPVGIAYLVLL